jgi:outer membrane protein OmpA-like peptidoglycan-associated protein
MLIVRHVLSLRFAVALLLAGAFLHVGCNKKIPPPAPTPPPAGELDLAGATQQIARDLGQQVGAAAEARTLVIDPMLDRATGQQTGVSLRVQEALGPAVTASVRGVQILEFNAEGAAKSNLVITGTVTPGASASEYTVSVALTNRQSGLVIAQSAARFREDGLDRSPTRFYNDSPALSRDRSVEGYLRTAETPAGKPADALYVQQIPTAALLAQALEAYNAERWEQALGAYSAAAARQDGQQLRTFDGIYLANMRLGRSAPAEEAFGKIAALGLATNNLAVKLLFQPGSSSEFWPDLSAAYPMWLRQIARATQSAGSCLNIIGHTSRSGSEAVNDRLSLQRAETVKRLLENDAKPLVGKLRTTGVGFRENIVGNGADNASDAIDRRVEFKVVSCGG